MSFISPSSLSSPSSPSRGGSTINWQSIWSVSVYPVLQLHEGVSLVELMQERQFDWEVSQVLQIGLQD